MSILCANRFTPLQRRSVQRFGGIMLLTVATNFTNLNLPNFLFDIFPGLQQTLQHHQHPSAILLVLFSVVAVIPVMLAMWVAGNYLTSEPDEFIRSLVIRALLWGFAFTMAGVAVAGVFMNLYNRPFPLTILSADIFFISSALALRICLRSYR